MPHSPPTFVPSHVLCRSPRLTFTRLTFTRSPELPFFPDNFPFLYYFISRNREIPLSFPFPPPYLDPRRNLLSPHLNPQSGVIFFWSPAPSSALLDRSFTPDSFLAKLLYSVIIQSETFPLRRPANQRTRNSLYAPRYMSDSYSHRRRAYDVKNFVKVGMIWIGKGRRGEMERAAR